MKKREDWPERLNAYLNSVRYTVAAWGTFDCCLMECDAILAMTDVDPGEEFRGKYTDAAGAYALIRAQAGDIPGLHEIKAAKYGWTEVPPARAQRGDPCVLKPEVIAGENRFGGVGAIMFGHAVAFVGQDRLLATARTHILRAWRIP